MVSKSPQHVMRYDKFSDVIYVVGKEPFYLWQAYDNGIENPVSVVCYATSTKIILSCELSFATSKKSCASAELSTS